MRTRFKCLKFVKSFVATYSSHPLLLYAQTSFQITLGISEKIPKNRFEDTELTSDGSYSMWNSLSKLEKEWNLQGWPTKTPHSLGVFYFGLGSVSRGVTHFYGSSFAMKLEFSSISKTNLTLAEFLKKYFINHHASFSGTDHW